MHGRVQLIVSGGIRSGAEDLAALTVEAAAMAGVPLAGTDWTQGRSQTLIGGSAASGRRCYRYRRSMMVTFA
jgi:hypothetical protein